jgi:hypothetical protein
LWETIRGSPGLHSLPLSKKYLIKPFILKITFQKSSVKEGSCKLIIMNDLGKQVLTIKEVVVSILLPIFFFEGQKGFDHAQYN